MVGSGGVWTPGGAAQVATNSSSFIPLVWSGNAGYHRLLTSAFRFSYLIVNDTGGDSCKGIREEIKATRWLDAKGPTTGIPDGYGTCPMANRATYTPGYMRSAGTAFKYTSAANLNAPFSVPLSVSAVSGYSQHVTAKWSFGSGGGVLCGDIGSPAASTRIYAGP